MYLPPSVIRFFQKKVALINNLEGEDIREVVGFPNKLHVSVFSYSPQSSGA